MSNRKILVVRIRKDWNLHIATDPEKLFGKLTIVITRIPVDLILEKLAAGDTKEDILNAYPKLSNDDVTACLLFATDSVMNEFIIPKAS